LPYHQFVKKLDLPSGFEAPIRLTYQDMVAVAITRAHLHDDIRAINASIELIQATRGGGWPTEQVTEEFDLRTELTEKLLDHDVDISWWVTPAAYKRGYYDKLYAALRDWLATEFPFSDPFYSNIALPSA
jgi:hypothetical protein